MNSTTVRLTDDEIDLLLLACNDFRKHTLPQYDEEDRRKISEELRMLQRKLRQA